MKRLQMMIEPEMDAELGRLAAASGRSKAALIRQFVRDGLRPLPPLAADPLFQMASTDDFEPADVDLVVYR